VLDGQIQAIDRHAPALPLGVYIRLVVELDIAHAGAHQRVQMHQFLDAQPARIGIRAIEAHDGHKAFGQQQFAEIQRAVVVEDLHPLDAHAAQLICQINYNLQYVETHPFHQILLIILSIMFY
jgi:hypothetical protein